MSSTRRQFLVIGGTAVAGAAVLSACGPDSPVNSSGTVASTDVPPTAPPVVASAKDKAADVESLRTATSLELSIVAAYTKLLASPKLTGAEARSWITTLQGHHRQYVTDLGKLITASDGKPYTKANKFVDDNLVAPLLKTASSESDLLALAATLEQAAAATLVLETGSLSVQDNRYGVMTIAGAESRNVSLLKLLASPGEFAAATADATVPVRNALGDDAAVK